MSSLLSGQDHLVLPVELIDMLNHAYFLHMLATDPVQVLPPGKSLLSVMSAPHTTADEEAKPTLHGKVEDLVHRAFWDEVMDTLSSPEPSVQLPRIKLLYNDLHVALSPLLPPKHPVLVTLSSPVPPTSSPLDSTLVHLREILASLRERCAPVRDPVIEAFQRALDDPSIRSPHSAGLAKLVTEAVGNILKLSEMMKDDLSQFVLGNMTEQQLRSVVSTLAKERERGVVIDIWRRNGIMDEWTSWQDKPHSPPHLDSISAVPLVLWIARTVQALGSPSPVSCPLPAKTVQVQPTASSSPDSRETTEPSTATNILPPVFFFSVPTLLEIQNYLQALVIAASLRTLTRLPAPMPSPSGTNTDSFMSRVWTLLHAEIAEEPDASDTKVINLADEVVRARTQTTPLAKEDEATLRAAVDRTLRVEDPVYKLLQRRLLTELCNVLIKRRQQDQDVGPAAVPTTLRTGRDGERVGKRPRLMLDLEDVHEPPRDARRTVIDVKGFEDPVLSRAVVEVFEQVDNRLRWVEGVWGDVIETGNIMQDGVGSQRSLEQV